MYESNRSMQKALEGCPSMWPFGPDHQLLIQDGSHLGQFPEIDCQVHVHASFRNEDQLWIATKIIAIAC